MATLQNWNHFDNHVQEGLHSSQAITGDSILLSFGPPELKAPNNPDGYSAVVWPAGTVGSFQMGQSVSAIPIPELGSRRRYTVVTGANGNVSLSKTLMHGPSLLRAAHAVTTVDNPQSPHNIEPLLPLGDNAAVVGNPHNYVHESPGYENFFINLASDIFKQQIGLMVWIRDTNGESYAAFYLEGCTIVNHSFGAAAGGGIISENCSLMYERVRPLDLPSSVPLTGQNIGPHIGVAGSKYTTGSGTPEILRQ